MNSYDHVPHDRSPSGMHQSGASPSDPNHSIRMAIKLGLILVFIVYLYVLVKVILFKFGGSNPGFYLRQLTESVTHPERILQHLRMMSNLVPMHEIIGNIHNLRSPSGFINFFGNIAAFMPLGFLLPLVCGFRSMPVLKVLLVSFGVSLALETAQLLLFIGTFDVDDLIMNTAGGVLGYGVLRVLQATAAPDIKKSEGEHHAELDPGPPSVSLKLHEME
ncbi:VanZ family protein [Paenibacillus dokdonensis]|uniref:VanZ family protein n=1 Tax=Paenibacillus dokdonensis TaxID=2567944 RepID=A0ABU6GLS1_9BACL|nr:VanZ family protein [Paenibacillus dokdonensis]MEC0240707.1 VanZ family protein [Paenibacillus dokdonensis]